MNLSHVNYICKVEEFHNFGDITINRILGKKNCWQGEKERVGNMEI